MVVLVVAGSAGQAIFTSGNGNSLGKNLGMYVFHINTMTFYLDIIIIMKACYVETIALLCKCLRPITFSRLIPELT